MPQFRIPTTSGELIRLLLNLGFEYKHGGKHAYKFYHPERNCKEGSRNFITFNPGNVDKNFSEIVIRREIIGAFMFTEEQVQFCYKKPIRKMPQTLSQNKDN